MKRLEAKLERIRAGAYKPTDVVITDAKDGDTGFGRAAPAPVRGGGGLKSKADDLAAMTTLTQSGLVDTMLASLSSAETPSLEA